MIFTRAPYHGTRELSAGFQEFRHGLQIGEAVVAAFRHDASADLGRVAGSAPVPHGRPDRIETFRRLSRVHYELTFLEMHLSDHSLRLLRPEAERQGCVSSVQLAACVGQTVRVAAVTAATRRVPSTGGVLQFLTLEDEHGVFEATLPPPVYLRVGGYITTPGPFLVTGRVDDDFGDVHLVVEDLLPFHRRRGPYGRTDDSAR